MAKPKLPSLADFRKIGVKMPLVGTYEFNQFLKTFMELKISVVSGKNTVDKQVKDVYTIHQVKKFLTKASHSFHGDSTMGKATRGYYHRVKPAKHYREMGRKRVPA